MIQKIITGGQSGGDISGNIYADNHEIPNEVNIFKDFKPTRRETYPKSTKVNYVCDKHHYIGNLVCRTQYNVEHSDITIILVKQELSTTKGSLLTSEKCMKFRKNYFVFDIYNKDNRYCIIYDTPYSELKKKLDVKQFWIGTSIEPYILNIAGQRELNNNDAVSFLEELKLY